MKRKIRCHICKHFLMHNAELCPIEADDGSIPEWCPYHVTSDEVEYGRVMREREARLWRRFY